MKFLLIVAICLTQAYCQTVETTIIQNDSEIVVPGNKVRHTSFPVLLSIIAFSSGFVLAVLFLAIALVYNK
jgi:hypothetical protein